MRHAFLFIGSLLASLSVWSHSLRAADSARDLSIARVSDHTLELRIGPAGSEPKRSPMLVDFPCEEIWRGPVDEAPPTLDAGALQVEITRAPLTVTVRRADGTLVQRLAWQEDGGVAFKTDAAVFGLGEGGTGFDRRGMTHSLTDGDFNGNTTSRVISPVLIGADGWALFVPDMPDVNQKRSMERAGLLGTFDLRGDHGVFRAPSADQPLRFLLVGVDRPAQIMAELRRLTGGAALPPRWSLGYMQSHRTLAGWDEVHDVARTFREKQLPCDALIYLSEVYCKSGWGNGEAPFAWSAGNFPDPATNLRDLHGLNFKVVVHATHYPSSLHGDDVSRSSEDTSHIATYWRQHLPIQETGVDAWWPDNGEDLTTSGRLARHRMYFEGPLQARPDRRPWSLHRTMAPGAQRYGGWIWSGDTFTTWAALAAHVPAALNTGLSLTPFWGSDIGGFVCKPELSAELFVRWFQFGAFSPSFRSHGRNWHLRLPWGWNTGDAGVYEEGSVPKRKELHNSEVEPICRKYLELRYRLLPYNYTLAREACDTGLPMMRALWLHHPDEAEAVKCSDAFLWGRDLLVAPVVEKGATARKIHLPRGTWFDWWTGDTHEGGREITRAVDLATLPIFARAGAIIPLDPVRQFTAQQVAEPTEIRVYSGADGDFTLYDDDGNSMEYLKTDGVRIRFRWHDSARTLSIEPANEAAAAVRRTFAVRVLPGTEVQRIDYCGVKTTAVAPLGADDPN
jgi:alpha-glucosidase (family GH31 glycosyl hydrolase)